MVENLWYLVEWVTDHMIQRLISLTSYQCFLSLWYLNNLKGCNLLSITLYILNMTLLKLTLENFRILCENSDFFSGWHEFESYKCKDKPVEKVNSRNTNIQNKENRKSKKKSRRKRWRNGREKKKKKKSKKKNKKHKGKKRKQKLLVLIWP